MVGWPSVILTPMGPSLNLMREGTSRPSLRSSLSLSRQKDLDRSKGRVHLKPEEALLHKGWTVRPLGEDLGLGEDGGDDLIKAKTL